MNLLDRISMNRKVLQENTEHEPQVLVIFTTLQFVDSENCQILSQSAQVLLAS